MNGCDGCHSYIIRSRHTLSSNMYSHSLYHGFDQPGVISSSQKVNHIPLDHLFIFHPLKHLSPHASLYKASLFLPFFLQPPSKKNPTLLTE